MTGTTCQGCGRVFTDSGYASHISSTRNHACSHIQHDSRNGPGPSHNQNPNNARPASHTSASSGSLFERLYGRKLSANAVAVDPEGDTFGPYTDIDFDMADSGVDNGPQLKYEVVLENEELEDMTVNLDTEIDSDEEEMAAEAAIMENAWQPDVPEHLQGRSRSVSPENFLSDEECDDNPPSPQAAWSDSEDEFDENINPRHEAEKTFVQTPHVEPFPDPKAGTPLQNPKPKSENDRYLENLFGAKTSAWAPFKSEMDWRIERWAKLRGPSSTALTDLLSIPGVSVGWADGLAWLLKNVVGKLVDKLELFFSSANELNKIIDDNLPARPQFQTHNVVVQGESFEVYSRNILECVKALFAEPDFAPYMKFAPERHWTDTSRKTRMFHDMHTGGWWWSRQVFLDQTKRGGTVIPIILSSDKRLVTNFCGKSAYPLYLTLGNIPKELRKKPSSRAYALVAYLPTSKLEHISVKAARWRAVANIFHTSMKHIMQPLETAGSLGMPLTSGDGLLRRGHPLLAVYTCDYPEQILVACACYGDCADYTEGPAEFVEACKEAWVKPIFDVFWKNLPYSNIFRCISPDILHQLYQGVMKHLKNWVLAAFSEAEIDARCRHLPPNHHVRVFLQGISSLSKITGQEHNEISRFLLSIIIDIPLPGGFSSVRLIRCVRALVDFLYLAQYPIHTDKTLELLGDSLERFHKNKDIFVDLEIRPHFRLPKLHFLNHYVQKIRYLGMLDNYNTEQTERLHIDLAKDGYRASNKKDEYMQITKWLERKEKVLRHNNFLNWLQSGKPRIQHNPSWLPSSFLLTRTLKMAKHPNIRVLSLLSAQKSNHTTYLTSSLARFIAQLRFPSASPRELENRAQSDVDIDLVSHVSSFNIIKFVQINLMTMITATINSIHVQPSWTDKKGRPIPGRFDTALVKVFDDNRVNPLKKYHVG
ncbi:hypothetical protein K435DRAFT_799989 [Dendrothele bispora CBS 962.96]|uniref:C2H2-type domain-containing protein n=1 Tax=Dendrothele bispora (strain CBS 962.96) TaxID=1314807 RepID=A0A4S8LUS1_DENBC|nr:hypothetical protein K435DRAFT_799989 [Dendrothele bispora CBS 962.96]